VIMASVRYSIMCFVPRLTGCSLLFVTPYFARVASFTRFVLPSDRSIYRCSILLLDHQSLMPLLPSEPLLRPFPTWVSPRPPGPTVLLLNRICLPSLCRFDYPLHHYCNDQIFIWINIALIPPQIHSQSTTPSSGVTPFSSHPSSSPHSPSPSALISPRQHFGIPTTEV